MVSEEVLMDHGKRLLTGVVMSEKDRKKTGGGMRSCISGIEKPHRTQWCRHDEEGQDQATRGGLDKRKTGKGKKN